MKERPILFSASMVRALLAGTKTQTRRAVKVESTLGIDSILAPRRAGGHAATYLLPEQAAEAAVCCPYGQPGDKLWVRETWSPNGPEPSNGSLYRADFPEGPLSIKFKPSIHMPRAASRILLEVTGVRVERLQDISDTDAIAEGIERDVRLDPAGTCHWRVYGAEQGMGTNLPGASYLSLWEQINGPGSWLLNPWVWVVEFKRVQQDSSGRPSQLEDAPCNE